jgi:hypothetical protein
LGFGALEGDGGGHDGYAKRSGKEHEEKELKPRMDTDEHRLLKQKDDT